MTFGKYLKQLRLGKNKTLRVFCEEISMLPSIYGGIERGDFEPPTKSEIIYITSFLGYSKTNDEVLSLLKLAEEYVNPKQLTEKELVGKFPFISHIKDEKQLDKIIKANKEFWKY